MCSEHAVTAQQEGDAQVMRRKACNSKSKYRYDERNKEKEKVGMYRTVL
jgi:hypothetical protein